MSRKYLYYCLIAVLVLVFITGILFVKSGKKSDATIFKEEYEKYNDTNLKLNIKKDNPFVYVDAKKAKKIINNNTAMIYIGSAKDDKSRQVVSIISTLAHDNMVKKIYYVDKSKIEDNSLKKYVDNKISVIFVISGEVIATYTYDEFNSSNIKKDINYYMQQTFSDYCDETCND